MFDYLPIGWWAATGIEWCSRNLELSQKLPYSRGGDPNFAEELK